MGGLFEHGHFVEEHVGSYVLEVFVLRSVANPHPCIVMVGGPSVSVITNEHDFDFVESFLEGYRSAAGFGTFNNIIVFVYYYFAVDYYLVVLGQEAVNSVFGNHDVAFGHGGVIVLGVLYAQAAKVFRYAVIPFVVISQVGSFLEIIEL